MADAQPIGEPITKRDIVNQLRNMAAMVENDIVSVTGFCGRRNLQKGTGYSDAQIVEYLINITVEGDYFGR
jgi:hypothetical protein